MTNKQCPSENTIENIISINPFDSQIDDEFNLTKVHIFLRQRNGKKSITTIEGLNENIDLTYMVKYFKKTFCCGGEIINHETRGKIISLQGDQRDNIYRFLIKEKICDKEHIIIHGF